MKTDSDLMLVRPNKRLDMVFEISIRAEPGETYAVPVGYYLEIKERGDNLLEEVRNPNSPDVRGKGYYMPVLVKFKE